MPPVDPADDPTSPEFEAWRVDDARQSYLDAIEAIRLARQGDMLRPRRAKDAGQGALC